MNRVRFGHGEDCCLICASSMRGIEGGAFSVLHIEDVGAVAISGDETFCGGRGLAPDAASMVGIHRFVSIIYSVNEVIHVLQTRVS